MTHTIAPAVIERAAKAIWKEQHPHPDYNWERKSNAQKNGYSDEAIAALTAALTPPESEGPIDLGYLDFIIGEIESPSSTLSAPVILYQAAKAYRSLFAPSPTAKEGVR